MENDVCVRVAKENDVEGFYGLWKICFGDSDNFCNWLFQNRFFPHYSVCLEKNGEIFSAMQAVPYTISVRGKDLPGAMLCGVSTHPDQRKKGYMRKIFTMEMNLLREKGKLLAVHTPAVLESYFAYGHFPVADALYMKGRRKVDKRDDFLFFEKSSWEELYPLYEMNIGQRYSGAVRRTKAEFLRKGEDYASDGGKCIVLKDDKIQGYAFVYLLEDELICPEAVANDGYYGGLLDELFALANGREISVKLPPDVEVPFEFGERILRQKGVAGVCNIGEILKKLEISCPYKIECYDPIVPENNGIFSFDGTTVDAQPAIKIEAGYFLGVLMGYVSLDDVSQFVTIYNKDGYDFMNQALPKCKCYIIDEY
ncbi:GNAT family N-acetyltransferase [Anaerotignum sp. MB30-C6]|uniref:GNAT family N-acetyltransferase n=1 Tax=Anaerotignum sp. MB30-C6 TaxID=3070814 RepID=UPI0027DE3B9B|nr:GNAT family N-acetyltransferase [Anaerotignum sp. MB30-C6]WMI82284.1 GNAT family N-acetyltransferase [Anaerotignum sp. MB30-C6]